MANASSSKVKCICGKPVKEGANFCPNCGIKYYRDDENIKCSSCGKEILAGDNYCQRCGKSNRSIESKKSVYEEFIVDDGWKKSNTDSRPSLKNDRVFKKYKKVNSVAINASVFIAATIITYFIRITINPSSLSSSWSAGEEFGHSLFIATVITLIVHILRKVTE